MFKFKQKDLNLNAKYSLSSVDTTKSKFYFGKIVNKQRISNEIPSFNDFMDN
jgi:hypothetical protein